MDNEEEKEGTSTDDTIPVFPLQEGPTLNRRARKRGNDQEDQHDHTKNAMVDHHKAHVVVSNVRADPKED